MTGEVRYILVSTTRGDELFSPRQSIVLESADREKLERLRDERAREREAWLRKYGSELPDYIEESLIDTEEIQAVTVDMSPQPLKPKELDPAVKAAAMAPEKKWHGDGTMFAYYGSVDGNIMLGQVTKINEKGDWNAYDLQHTNPEGTGALLIDGSPFAGKAQAKKAVEDYWSVSPK